MKRTCFFLLALLLSSGKNAAASQAVRLETPELFHRAQRVVSARCLGAVSTFTSADRRRIFTEFAFEVEEYFRGSGPRIIKIIQPGGRLGRVVQRTWGYAEFNAGERLLLLLRDGPVGLQTVGLSQGVFVWQAGDQELRQRLQGLEFPGGPAAACILSRQQLLENLRLYHFQPDEARP